MHLAGLLLSLAPLVWGLPFTPNPLSPQLTLSSLVSESFRRCDPNDPGVGHLSEWARKAKRAFLSDLKEDTANEWIIVIGNEGGDLDSVASAIGWAYHLWHQPTPHRAIPIIQTEKDGLDLRPENQLALHYSKMTSHHADLLTIDELPILPWALATRIEGLALVDHATPLKIWENAKIISIIDHHVDEGQSPGAIPRVFGKTASCATLVADLILNQREGFAWDSEDQPGYGPFPGEIAELLMRAIAIDSNGLNGKKNTKLDETTAERLLQYTQFKGREVDKVMKMMSLELSDSQLDIDNLVLRDLLRRDWKGDAIPTQSLRHPYIVLGFASIPYSMEYQIARTPEGSPPEWFAVERAFTSERQCDVTLVLSKSKKDKGKTIRQLALIVAHGYGGRLTEGPATRLFKAISKAIDQAPELEGSRPWQRPDGKKLLKRRAVWVFDKGEGAGRKVVRPIVEAAVREWTG